MAKILIVDDQEDMRWTLSAILKDEHYDVITAENGQSALKLTEEEQPDVVLLDIKLPDIDGFTVLSRIKKIDDTLPVIMLTAFADVKSAIKSIKMGAFDYLSKPFDNDELMINIKKALDSQKLHNKIEILRQRVQETAQMGVIIGKSQAMQKVIAELKRVAPTDMTIILEGESGSGKEVIARLAHKMSKRADGPFVAIDCGTLPENLVESELFGYEKGAFTGADKRKLGYFELASEGTMFLDEITNLSLGVQAKLLRVLQEKKVQHLGGKKEINIDVRIIIASNVNLKTAVEKRQFREDLFHRLNEFSIVLPPLRNRKNDILMLAQNFLQEANKELKKDVKVFSKEASEIIEEYNWPGNVRELKNTIKRAVLLADKIILPQHLGISRTEIQFMENHAKTPFKVASKKAAEEVEKHLIEETLEEVKFNKTKAAKVLGIDRKALYYKIKKFHIKIS